MTDIATAAIEGEVLPPARTKAARPRKRSLTIKGEAPSPMTDPNPYVTMDGATRTLARGAASDVKAASRRATRDVIACGAKLVELKKKLRHGHWMKWLAFEFGASDRTVRNYVSVAMAFGLESETVSNLTPTDLYLLARKSTPPEARQVVIDSLKKGESVSHDNIVDWIDAARPSRDELGKIAPRQDALAKAAGMIVAGIAADELSELVGLLKAAAAVPLARAIDLLRHDAAEAEDLADDGDEVTPDDRPESAEADVTADASALHSKQEIEMEAA